MGGSEGRELLVRAISIIHWKHLTDLTIGEGYVGVTALSTCSQFWYHSLLPMWRQLIVRTVTPILGAVIADQYLGKYKTIVLFTIIYISSILVLFLTSLPVSLNNGAGLGGFIASILIIGIGTGGIKSNVAPLTAEQYQCKKMAIRTLASGERVILDPAKAVWMYAGLTVASFCTGTSSSFSSVASMTRRMI